MNYRDLRNERGLSGYDLRLSNTTTLIYDLPFGESRKFGSSCNRGADAALGGWRLTAINFATSGIPVNLSYGPAATFQVSGAPTYRLNVIGDPRVPSDQRKAEFWLDPAKVLLPTDVSRPFGNAGQNLRTLTARRTHSARSLRRKRRAKSSSHCATHSEEHPHNGLSSAPG